MHLRRAAKFTSALATVMLAIACSPSSRQGASDDQSLARRDGPVGPYLALQAKLAHDEIDGLDTLAADMVVALEGASGAPGTETMLAAAGRVGAKDIDTARAAFRKLSLGMLDYLRSTPEAQSGLVVVHCPMTFEGEGAAWVQTDGPVMNPYEGAMMLHCGDRVDWTWQPE